MNAAIRDAMAKDTLASARLRLEWAETRWADIRDRVEPDHIWAVGFRAFIAELRDNVARLDPNAHAILDETAAIVAAAVGADWLGDDA